MLSLSFWKSSSRKIDEKKGIGHGKDLDGRIVWVLAEIRAKTILIIGLYGPSAGDREEFFRDELFPIMRNKNYDHCNYYQ